MASVKKKVLLSSGPPISSINLLLIIKEDASCILRARSVTFSPNDASICPRSKDMYMIRTAPLATPTPTEIGGVPYRRETLSYFYISDSFGSLINQVCSDMNFIARETLHVRSK